uniref:Uncharacterized protein n=1 Tax=Oryza glumipatula TaxID=40148 RepID=A0A0D9ZPE8_9ORYZ
MRDILFSLSLLLKKSTSCCIRRWSSLVVFVFVALRLLRCPEEQELLGGSEVDAVGEPSCMDAAHWHQASSEMSCLTIVPKPESSSHEKH